MLITLTTDFGSREGYPAAMKGVIFGIVPEAKIVDITHEIEPQNLAEAAFILEINAFHFPADTVHIAVVDPGVGSERRPLVGRIGSQRFVVPDNGVISRLLLCAEREGWPVELFHADRPQYWRDEISATFHGRDIFAPLGAHLASGVALEELGTQVDDPLRMLINTPAPFPGSVRGEVIHIDHFGNAITNIRSEDIAGLGEVQIRLGGRKVHGLVNTFSDRPPGTLLALWDSSGYLMVSEYGGLQQIWPLVGDEVLVLSVEELDTGER